MEQEPANLVIWDSDDDEFIPGTPPPHPVDPLSISNVHFQSSDFNWELSLRDMPGMDELQLTAHNTTSYPSNYVRQESSVIERVERQVSKRNDGTIVREVEKRRSQFVYAGLTGSKAAPLKQSAEAKKVQWYKKAPKHSSGYSLWVSHFFPVCDSTNLRQH